MYDVVHIARLCRECGEVDADVGSTSCEGCRTERRRLEELHLSNGMAGVKPPDIEDRIRKYQSRAARRLPLFEGVKR
jgi:hypothetical protein